MTDTEKMIETACLYLEGKLKFARLIINNNVDPEFPQKLFSLEAIKDSAMRKCSALPSRTEAEYLFTYMTYGAYRIISFWLNKEEREAPGEIARILSKILLA